MNRKQRKLFSGALSLLAFGLIFSLQLECRSQNKAISCEVWQDQLVRTEGLLTKENIDFDNEREMFNAFECLLKLEKNKSASMMGGATRLDVSDTTGFVSIEVAALYYVSYLFWKDWEHARLMALTDGSGKRNDVETVEIAFKSYNDWFKRIKEIGLKKAREKKIDPLAGSGVRWY